MASTTPAAGGRHRRPPRQLVLRRGDAVLSVDLDAGGRVAALSIGDLDLIARLDDSPTHWGSFVMAPWAGRIRHGRFRFRGHTYQLPTDLAPPHAIHGTVLDRPWTVIAATQTSAVLECPLEQPWPWPGRVLQRIAIEAGRVEFGLEVHAAALPFPAVAGWHPWFRRQLDRGGRVEIGLDAAAVLARDGQGIASGARVPVPDQPWDDCFDGIRWPITLTWPDALRLEISASTGYAVVFTEPADAVCIEPQTGPPDAVNLEPDVVTAERPLTATMTWSW